MSDLLRVSLTGGLPGGEVWSVNPVYSLPGSGSGPTFEELNTLAQDIAALELPAGLQTTMSGFTNWSGCRVESRTTAGTLVNVAEALRSSPVNGSSSTPHPYQTSVVASLRSANASGRGRGRLYWPATGVPLVTDTLRISSTTRDTIASAFVSFLAAINAEIQAYDTGAALVVWSRTAGQLFPVDRVTVGDVLDTQRRRRDTLAENITVRPYVILP